MSPFGPWRRFEHLSLLILPFYLGGGLERSSACWYYICHYGQPLCSTIYYICHYAIEIDRFLPLKFIDDPQSLSQAR